MLFRSQDKATFERSRLIWNELTQPEHKEMLDWYKKLIQLRQSHPELTEGSFENVQMNFSEEGKWLTLQRGFILTAINIASQPAQIPVPATAEILLASSAEIKTENETLHLSSNAVAILKRKK